MTDAKVELGKLLYFDPRLSRDHSMSCATCHHPDHGWADGKPLAIGFDGKVLGRHSPTVLNAAYNTPQFWDGRAKDLEEQAAGPIMAAGEMNMGTEAEVVARLGASPEYARRFNDVFGEPPTLQRAAHAIAAFEKTLVTPNSRFDLYAGGDKAALDDAEKRGLILFIGKAQCTQCHNGPNFTDNKHHNLGALATDKGEPDPGRYAITKVDADFGAFKTATVRNVAVTAPYMHDGSLATLDAVVDFYDRGGGDAPNKSNLVQPLELTPSEKSDLISFLHALTGDLPEISIPALPESAF